MDKDLSTATEALNSIPKFLEAFQGILENPSAWVVLVGFLFWSLLKKDSSHLFDLVERKKKNRLKDIENYISNAECACNDSLPVIKDLRDAYYFESATGIYAEKLERKKLINLYNSTSIEINWITIKRATPYFETSSSDDIQIKEFTKIDKLSYWYNCFSGILLFISAALLLLSFLFSDDKNLVKTAAFSISFIFIILFALFLTAQNWPANAAKKIKVTLKNKALNNDSNCV
ncbi:hypothetical protein [Pelagibaculum spongiae]|uniref:Uncharacterized protein n=1 Tax=Pelagibaculum spongiae TaxID=2080658 RepID=A0A2V1GQ51_9GAMM|nr:hypothetical protein [Pelagibaculum spongiae]PVZ63446.1 hypothetical protein DC094_21300 [Pelagibaculum spongiae]